MVVLSLSQVKAKTKLDKLEEVKNLNVCGQGIDDVSILQQAPNIEVLSLSVNKISSLRHFAFCSQLKQLYLRANVISDLAEVRYLMGLEHLRVLWLADNPCTKLPYYRAVVVANLPKLDNLDNVAVNDADRQAARGIRQLQPATAADVLAEEQQEAAAIAAVQQTELQQQAGEQQQAGGSFQVQSAAVLPPQASSREPRRSSHQHQALPSITSSPRPSASASSVPLTAAGAAAAAPSAGLPRRRSATARSGASPEPPDTLGSGDSSPSLGCGVSIEQGGRRPSSARTAYATQAAAAAAASRTPSRAPSPTGSYRASPEPHSDGALLQHGGRAYSVTVTPRDLGSAGCTAGAGTVLGQQQGEASDTLRQQLYGEHSFGSSAKQLYQQHHQQQHSQPHQHPYHQQQEQCKAWPGAVRPEQAGGHLIYAPGSPGCPPPGGQQQQQQVPAWPPRGAGSAGHHYPTSGTSGVSPPSASRTNVLYAVMALLGELDVSGLGIVQREVQMRLMEQQQ